MYLLGVEAVGILDNVMPGTLVVTLSSRFLAGYWRMEREN
jgi:hypothetical protein